MDSVFLYFGKKSNFVHLIYTFTFIRKNAKHDKFHIGVVRLIHCVLGPELCGCMAAVWQQWTLLDSKNCVAEHRGAEKHTINWEGTRVLTEANTPNGYHLRALESIAIKIRRHRKLFKPWSVPVDGRYISNVTYTFQSMVQHKNFPFTKQETTKLTHHKLHRS